MGWNSWNLFGCDLNEDALKQQVDMIIQLGLDQLGYKYFVLDDCWMDINRRSDGHL